MMYLPKLLAHASLILQMFVKMTFTELVLKQGLLDNSSCKATYFFKRTRNRSAKCLIFIRFTLIICIGLLFKIFQAKMILLINEPRI